MSGALLVATGLGKRFGDVTAVSGLDLTLESGEVLGLAGRNGAGKSTTIAMLSGALAPDSGRIELTGERLARRSRRLRSMIGLVPQEAAVYPELSARDNLACFGGLFGLHGLALRRRTDEVLEIAGLGGVADRPAGRLSGGMRRRLSIAVALVHRPRLLLLDEPTSGLDLEFRPRLVALVRELAGAGVGVVWAGHDLGGLERVWSAVVLLDRGRPSVRTSVAELVAGERAGKPGPLEAAVGALLEEDVAR